MSLRPSQMADHLFTVVCEFDGGSYVSQVRARDERQALVEWGHALRTERPMGDDADRIASELSGDADAPAPLSGLAGVWCWTMDLDCRLVLANFIRSA